MNDAQISNYSLEGSRSVQEHPSSPEHSPATAIIPNDTIEEQEASSTIIEPSQPTNVVASFVPHDQENDITAAASGPFNPEDEVNLIATSPLSEMKYEPEVEESPIASSTKAAQQVATSLVSPPESTHTDAEKTPPATAKAKGVASPGTSASSRHSSRPAKQAQRYTPESGTVRRASTSSAGVAFGRESGSPTTSVGTSGTSHKKMKSRMNSEIEADEESLKLIRALQAEELGLRRRGNN